MRILLVSCAALALSVGAASAVAGGGHGKGDGHGKSGVHGKAAGVHGNADGVHGNSSGVHGNSDAAHKCQKGGYKNWVRDDGTVFENTGECVSYAARGGMLNTQSQQGCKALQGTFSTDPATDQTGFADPSRVVWTCNGWQFTDLTSYNEGLAALGADCQADVLGGGLSLYVGTGTADTTCVRPLLP